MLLTTPKKLLPSIPDFGQRDEEDHVESHQAVCSNHVMCKPAYLLLPISYSAKVSIYLVRTYPSLQATSTMFHSCHNAIPPYNSLIY